MTLTHIEIDDETLASVVQLSGARTREEAVNLALREFVLRHRVAALEHSARLAAGWDFEGWKHRRAAEKYST